MSGLTQKQKAELYDLTFSTGIFEMVTTIIHDKNLCATTAGMSKFYLDQLSKKKDEELTDQQVKFKSYCTNAMTMSKRFMSVLNAYEVLVHQKDFESDQIRIRDLEIKTMEKTIERLKSELQG